MARRTKKQEQKIGPGFPYTEFMGTDLWRRLDRAIGALRKNGDIEELTARRYIVGYLAKTVSAVMPKERDRSARRETTKRAARI